MLDFGFYNMDCMQGMKEFPDNYFELAIVDPPYGDGGVPGRTEHGSVNGPRGTRIHQCNNLGQWATRRPLGGVVYQERAEHGRRNSEKIVAWDVAPGKEYFDELFRVSRSQIIWGGNYFPLPATRCFIIWRKTNVPEKFSMAMAEYAWTSFNANAKVFDYSAVGQDGRFHPTQKPVALYKWLLQNYAKPGDKILDTHVGSASSLIACYDMGFDYVGFEIDEEYYNKASKRLEEEMLQTRWRF